MEREVKLYHAGTLTYTRATLVILFCWLLWGDFCYMLMETVVPSILPLKFKDLGASNTAIGMILTTIPMMINSVFNPIISFKSDRCRSRWGRRIPFILFSVPVIVIFLLGVGFADRIGFWLHEHISQLTMGLTANQFSVMLIGFMMVIFSFFNTFVNSVFWYLFNDVVPESLLARFMSWFRIVTMLAASIYNFFIFKYAGSHATEIFIGAAILYLIGFSLMCPQGKRRPISATSGQCRQPKRPIAQCGHLLQAMPQHASLYLYLSGRYGICWHLGRRAVRIALFVVDRSKPGTNRQYRRRHQYRRGHHDSTFRVLADRFHPIRIVILGIILQIILGLPAAMTWLFFSPSPQTSYWLCMIYAIALTAPISALLGVLDPPMFMRLFPRQLYGQFCSANAMWRSVSMIVNGTLVGVIF